MYVKALYFLKYLCTYVKQWFSTCRPHVAQLAHSCGPASSLAAFWLCMVGSRSRLQPPACPTQHHTKVGVQAVGSGLPSRPRTAAESPTLHCPPAPHSGVRVPAACPAPSALLLAPLCGGDSGRRALDTVVLNLQPR